jgi:putative flippase GtrA
MKALAAWAGAPAVRFVASGAFNTGVTWLLYVALLQWLPYAVSYTIVYAAGIALAYFLNRHVVFRRAGSRLAPLWVALIYVGQYAAGLLLVMLWVDVLHAPAFLAPLFAVAITLPVTYFLNRRVFNGTQGRDA